ncbi:MAG: hypothetical protein AAFU85_20550 [Planctomycetota bacterium]
MSIHSKSLDPLSRGGYYYCDEYSLIEFADRYELDFSPFPWRRLAAYSCFIGCMFCLLCVASHMVNAEPIPYGPLVLAVILTPAPFYVPTVRRLSLRRHRPFLGWTKGDGIIELHRGKQTVNVDDVHSIVDATFHDHDGDAVCEIQMCLQPRANSNAVLIACALGDARHGLRRVAMELAAAISSPHVTFDNRGPMQE